MDSRVVVTRGWRGGVVLEIFVEGYKLPVIRLTTSGGLMYSIVGVANNAVLYTYMLLRE